MKIIVCKGQVHVLDGWNKDEIILHSDEDIHSRDGTLNLETFSEVWALQDTEAELESLKTK